jgi:hypothetical protein
MMPLKALPHAAPSHQIPQKIMLPTIMLVAPLSPWYERISQWENLKTDFARHLSTLKQLGSSAQRLISPPQETGPFYSQQSFKLDWEITVNNP